MADGIVTNSSSPNYNPYKFFVYRNGAWTTSSSLTVVNLDTVVYDTNGNFDTTTNFRYTVPVAGFYFFSGAVSATVNSGAPMFASIYKNGSEHVRGMQLVQSATSGGACVVSAQLQLAVNDTIQLAFAGTAGATGNIGNAPYLTHFSGYLVSRA